MSDNSIEDKVEQRLKQLNLIENPPPYLGILIIAKRISFYLWHLTLVISEKLLDPIATIYPILACKESNNDPVVC